MKTWIFDEADPPQGFPLRKLFEETVCSVGSGRLSIRSCDGYGERINSWARRLEHVNQLAVDPDELNTILTNADEWFYNLRARWENGEVSVEFGLHDSTALYVDGPPELVAAIGKRFASVRSNA